MMGTTAAEMALVSAAEFWMGSTPADVERVIEECRRGGNDEARCKDWFERESPVAAWSSMAST